MSEATHLQRRTWFTQYRTSDVAENVGSTFLVRIVYSPGERVCIDSNGKNGKSRGGYFGSGFRQSVIIAELWQPEVARPGNIFSNFCRFFGKTTSYSEIFKILFRTFHRLTDRRCCVQISQNVADGKSAKSCVIYLIKQNIFGCLLNCRYCSDRAQNLPWPPSQ